MELRVKQVSLPEAIEFNFDELKAEITERVKDYENLTYTEDQIKEAKADKAKLNKFVNTLSDARKQTKKEFLEPYNKFEARIKELDSIVQKAIKNIDEQVKGYEEVQRAEKKQIIENYFNETVSDIGTIDFVRFEQVFKESYLNKTSSMAVIKKEISERLQQISKDATMLYNLPDIGYEAFAIYEKTLDVNKAVEDAKQMAEIRKRKVEEEIRKNVNPPTEQPKQATVNVAENDIDSEDAEEKRTWLSFKAFLTIEDALALKAFFNDRDIPFRNISE